MTYLLFSGNLLIFFTFIILFEFIKIQIDLLTFENNLNDSFGNILDDKSNVLSINPYLSLQSRNSNMEGITNFEVV